MIWDLQLLAYQLRLKYPLRQQECGFKLLVLVLVGDEVELEKEEVVGNSYSTDGLETTSGQFFGFEFFFSSPSFAF